VVEKLERLNLTWEVRDGIVNSSKVREDIFAEGYGIPSTLEGQVVKLSDAVAYINHDIADATRAGLITEDELPLEVTRTLGARHSGRLNTLVCDVIEHSWAATGDARPDTPVSQLRIGMSEEVSAAANALREFMFQRVYLWEGRREESERAKRVVASIYGHYLENPNDIESDFVIASDPPWRRAADYVSGMTDHFALEVANRLSKESAGKLSERAPDH